MVEVYCRICGEEWDNDYIYNLPPTQRAAFRLGLGCPKCCTRDEPSKKEKRLARISIEEMRNKISKQRRILIHKTTPGKLISTPLPSNSEIYELLEDFFISCQIAEGRIKPAYSKGLITKEDVDVYNTSIGKEVDIVLGISTYSPGITEMIRDLVETKPFVMEILRTLSNPEAWQFLKRKYPPPAISLDLRYGKERGR